MLYIFIFLSLYICLFIIFSLSKNDFILLRKGISTLNIFNIVFISLFMGFVFGRIFYSLDAFRFGILHPLSFFHVLNSAGFSFYGFVLGLFSSLTFSVKEKKALPRIFDIFSLSLFPFLILYLYLNFQMILLKSALILLILFLFIFFLNSYKIYRFKDGTISICIIILLTFANFFAETIHYQKKMIYFLSFSEILGIVVIISSIILLFKNEKILKFKK